MRRYSVKFAAYDKICSLNFAPRKTFRKMEIFKIIFRMPDSVEVRNNM